jgi:Protein of unknown function (DUF1559)
MTATMFKLTVVTTAVLCAVTAGGCGFATPSAASSPAAPLPPAGPKPATAGERVADARQRLVSQNNLKRILLAFHEYHDKHGHFPHDIYKPDIYKDGKALLSWRVAILPYVEQEKLYKEFKLDEPWDSEHNKKLLAKMPDVYRVGFELKGETKTYYQGFAGPGTVLEPWREVFEKDGKSVTIPSVKKVTLFQITDGTANTLAVVEAGPPVEWTKPADLPYDPKKPLPKLDGPFTNVLVAATADGATHLLRPDLDETTLRRLIERADGEKVSPEALRANLFTKEDEAAARKTLKESDTLALEIAAEIAAQHRLLEELAKWNREVLDLAEIEREKKELEQKLAALKIGTALLRMQLELIEKK